MILINRVMYILLIIGLACLGYLMDILIILGLLMLVLVIVGFVVLLLGIVRPVLAYIVCI